jgi:hypothetical protein
VDTLEENDIALGVYREVWGATAAQDQALRAADPPLATRWRRDLRAIVDEPLANGCCLAGMTADYRYVLRPPRKESP